MASNTTATLLNALAPDGAGLDKIIGIPPGTAMYYQSLMRDPRNAVGGYGLAENQRYGRQVDQYVHSLNDVNASRSAIAKQMMDNDERDSLRKLLANTHKTDVDAGLMGAMSPTAAGVSGYDTTNPALRALFDTSDQQSFMRRGADTLEHAGAGLDSARQGGFAPGPNAAGDTLGLDGVKAVIPTRVAAASAGNSGSGGGSGSVTVTDDPVLGRRVTQKFHSLAEATGAINAPDNSLAGRSRGRTTTGIGADGTPKPSKIVLSTGTPSQQATVDKLTNAGLPINPDVQMLPNNLMRVDAADGSGSLILHQDGTVYEGPEEDVLEGRVEK